MLMPIGCPTTESGGSSCTAWEIDTTVFTNYATIGAPYASPSDVFLKSDGTKIFTLTGSGYVQNRTLSTAWDITSVGLPGTENITAQSTDVQGLHLKSNGAKMYVLGGTNVYQYTLGTPYDVTTSSYDSVSFNVTTQETTPRAVRFNGDGTKMYILGEGNDTVYQYSLTAWDLSTASYASKSFSVASQATSPAGLAFSVAGDKMYVVNGGTDDKLYQYTLSTPWDVSTASYDSKSVSLATTGNSPVGVHFATDGLNFYTVDTGSGKMGQWGVC